MATLEAHITTIDMYVQHGYEPGSGTRAILENNLFEAMSRCDEQSQLLLPEIVKYIYNRVPGECWGSREKVNAWIRRKRIERNPVMPV